MIPQDYWPGPDKWPPRMPPGTPQPIVPGEIPGMQPTQFSGFSPPGGPNAGPTDTVPAWLTPGEAVLNRNAANLAGRGNINDLNKLGGAMGYAQGVGYVDPKDIDPMQQNVQLSAGSISPAFISELKAKAAQSGISSAAFNGLLQAVMKEYGKSGQAAPPDVNYLAAGSSTPVYGASGYPSAIPVQGYRMGGNVGDPEGGPDPASFTAEPDPLGPFHNWREGIEAHPEWDFREFDRQGPNWSTSSFSNPFLGGAQTGSWWSQYPQYGTFGYNQNYSTPWNAYWNQQGIPYAAPASYNFSDPTYAGGGRHAFPSRQRA